MDASLLLSDTGEGLKVPSEPADHFITAVPTIMEDGSVSYLLMMHSLKRSISPVEEVDEHPENNCQITEQRLDGYEIDSKQPENNCKITKHPLDSYEQPGNNFQIINPFNGSEFDYEQPENIQIIIQENIRRSIEQPMYQPVLSVNNVDENGNIQDEEEATFQSVDVDDLNDDKSNIEKKTIKKGRDTINCSQCNYSTDHKYLLNRHMVSHSKEKPYRCTICEKTFRTPLDIRSHINTHLGTKPHKCHFCEQAFNSSGEVIRHTRYKHTHEKPYKCSECDRAFVESPKLRRHMRSHFNERPYQCPHCTYAAVDNFKLKRHLRVHTHEKPYKCRHCDSAFSQSNAVKSHELIHKPGGRSVYPCEKCSNTFRSKDNLRIHIAKLHYSVVPIECKICKQCFPDRYTHKIHAKTHRGEKIFKCSLCSFATSYKRHLISHTFVHMDLKPFECEICEDVTFRQMSLLQRHLNLYHNPGYVAPVHRTKSSKCRDCGRLFARKGNLRNHQLANHSPDAETEQKRKQDLKKGRAKKIWKKRLKTAADFIDLSAAYDTVWRKGLLVKLYDTIQDGNIVRLIEQLLTGRIYRVYQHVPDKL